MRILKIPSSQLSNEVSKLLSSPFTGEKAEVKQLALQSWAQ